MTRCKMKKEKENEKTFHVVAGADIEKDEFFEIRKGKAYPIKKH